MVQTKQIRKERPFGLYGIAFQRIKELEKFAHKESSIIRFPTVFERICKTFSIPKPAAWEVLFALRDFGFIEIVKFQGIKVMPK